MARFSVNFTKEQRSLAKATIKAHLVDFKQNKKYAMKVARAENILKALGKKVIILTGSECTMIRRCSTRSAVSALKGLKGVNPITDKHVEKINSLNTLASLV